MKRLERQDPTFKVKSNVETGQTIISGMGELHLEIIQKRMQRDFNLKVKFHKPRVSYREKLLGEVTIREEFTRALPSGTISFGLTLLARELKDTSSGIVVGHRIPAEAMPKQLLQILLEQVQKEAEGGGIYGNPISGLNLVIQEVRYNEG